MPPPSQATYCCIKTLNFEANTISNSYDDVKERKGKSSEIDGALKLALAVFRHARVSGEFLPEYNSDDEKYWLDTSS